jgi:hypothetical protein
MNGSSTLAACGQSGIGAPARMRQHCSPQATHKNNTCCPDQYLRVDEIIIVYFASQAGIHGIIFVKYFINLTTSK